MPGLKLKHVPPHDCLPPALADMTNREGDSSVNTVSVHYVVFVLPKDVKS